MSKFPTVFEKSATKRLLFLQHSVRVFTCENFGTVVLYPFVFKAIKYVDSVEIKMTHNIVRQHHCLTDMGTAGTSNDVCEKCYIADNRSIKVYHVFYNVTQKKRSKFG